MSISDILAVLTIFSEVIAAAKLPVVDLSLTKKRPQTQREEMKIAVCV